MKIWKRLCWWRKQNAKPSSAMNNVVNSMFLSKPLYDKLKVKCHPDRFIDENKKEEAQYLFQELQKYKYNIEQMRKLENKINLLND